MPGHSLGHNYRYTVKKDNQLKTDWFDKALCKGTSTALFFHDDRREPEQTKAAKDVCKTCPVCKECLKRMNVIDTANTFLQEIWIKWESGKVKTVNKYCPDPPKGEKCHH